MKMCNRCHQPISVRDHVTYGSHCEDCWSDTTAYRTVPSFRIMVGREQPTGDSQGRGRHHKSKRWRGSLSYDEQLDAMKALLGIKA